MLTDRYWKTLALVVLVALAVGGATRASLDECVASYQKGSFVKAAQMAQPHADQPVARLVLALCRIHDLKNQDLAEGLAGLEVLFTDEQVDHAIRLEAKLSYVRTVQLLQVRGRHREYDDVEVEALYRELIAQAASTRQGCFAAVYLAEFYFEQYLENDDTQPAIKGMEFLEEFIANYEGRPQNLIPVHIFADKLYTKITKDYTKSFEHLQEAYRLGITPVTVRRGVLFKLGRISDLKLDDKATALKYYEEYLKLYPNSKLSPMIRKYHDNLTGENH